MMENGRFYVQTSWVMEKRISLEKESLNKQAQSSYSTGRVELLRSQVEMAKTVPNMVILTKRKKEFSITFV